MSGDARMDDREKDDISVIDSESSYEKTSSESESDSEPEDNEGQYFQFLQVLALLWFWLETFDTFLADVKTEPAEEEQTAPILTPVQRMLRLGFKDPWVLVLLSVFSR